MEKRKLTTHGYKHGSVIAPRLPQTTRLTAGQLEEKKYQKGFVTVVIENTLKVTSILGRIILHRL